MTHPLIGAATLAALAATVMACSGSSAASLSPTAPTTTVATTTTTTTTTTPVTPTAPATSGVQAIYAQFVSGVTVSIDGATVTLRTNDLPDHRSPYWGSTSANYEAPHAGMQVNPHLITTQNLTFRLPASPAAASAMISGVVWMKCPNIIPGRSAPAFL